MPHLASLTLLTLPPIPTQLHDLRSVCAEYKHVLSEKEDLEDEIQNLKLRLKDFGVKEAENSALEGQLEGASRLLSDRVISQIPSLLPWLMGNGSALFTVHGRQLFTDCS